MKNLGNAQMRHGLKPFGQRTNEKKVTKTYNCPVHLDVVKHSPGKCPQCGRKLNLSPKEQLKAKVVKLYT